MFRRLSMSGWKSQYPAMLSKLWFSIMRYTTCLICEMRQPHPATPFKREAYLSSQISPGRVLGGHLLSHLQSARTHVGQCRGKARQRRGNGECCDCLHCDVYEELSELSGKGIVGVSWTFILYSHLNASHDRLISNGNRNFPTCCLQSPFTN